MKKQAAQLILRKEDYEYLSSYVKANRQAANFDRSNAELLYEELKKATLVNKENFPPDAIGLNSKVTIKDEARRSVMDIMLVTPDKADIKQRKISILAPIATALIGFRKGQKVDWTVPSGKKTFTIMDVMNIAE